MDRRVRITLPEPVVRRLETMAEDADEPVSRVAAQFVRQGLEELGTGGDGTPARRELSRAALPRVGAQPSVPRGLSHTAGIESGAAVCGVRSSPCTGATRRS
jgi:hypothetical protein